MKTSCNRLVTVGLSVPGLLLNGFDCPLDSEGHSTSSGPFYSIVSDNGTEYIPQAWYTSSVFDYVQWFKLRRNCLQQEVENSSDWEYNTHVNSIVYADKTTTSYAEAAVRDSNGNPYDAWAEAWGTTEDR